MNTGIKNKLKELIGKEVDFSYSKSGIVVYFPSTPNVEGVVKYKILRIEDDCVVIENVEDERYISIDHISTVIIKK